ncbi:MAG TPA: hypothetical protein VI318_14050 [Baekduia sp.]
MRSLTRRHLTPLAAACALALIPAAAARAAVVQIVPVDSVPNGIAMRNGQLYVVEPQAKRVEILSPTGEKRGAVGLPGDIGAATSAAVGPDGLVWVAISSGADKGFVKIDDAPAAIPLSTAGAFGCGPVGMAADPANQRMLYTAPAGTGPACGTHGMGAITAAGVNQIADTTVPDAYALAVLNGKAFVPGFDTDAIQRLGIGPGAFTSEATIGTAAGGAPNGIAVRSLAHDVWVALQDSGAVLRLDPGAPDGSTTMQVTSGLSQPAGMAAHPDNSVWVASSGDGRIVRIGYAGSTESVALPAGFQPWQVAAPDGSGPSDGSVWVTDMAAGRVARVLDVAPRVSVPADVTGPAVPVTVFTGGSATRLVVHVDGAKDIDGGTLPAAFGEQTVDVPLGSLPAGAYTITADVINDLGMATTPAAGHFTVAAAATTPPPAPPKTAKPKKLTFADVVSVVAAKKCVTSRTLRLTLRKRKTGAKVTSLKVTVGHGKARTYRGKTLKSALTLKALPKRGSYRLRVVVTLSDKTKLTLTRTYRACAVKKNH